MTKAPAQDQRQLLEIQGLDTLLDQIAHKRTTHPTVARLGELDSQVSDLTTSLISSRTAVGDLRRELTKAEGDVEQVRTRTQRNQERLDSGAVGAKDAQALMSELESLVRRQSALEDVELEVMERLEAHETSLAAVEQAHSELVSARDAVEQEQLQAYADLEAQASDVRGQREAKVQGVSEALLGLYEKLRARMGGMAVAALRHGRSEASGMPISPMELNRIKALPEDEVVFCEDSGRILVRGDDAY